MQPATAAYEAKLNAVSLELPTFWTSQLGVWFRQAKSQFYIRGVTVNETRYHYVVSVLVQETASRVVPYLDNPSAVGKYTGLKELLLRIYGPS